MVLGGASRHGLHRRTVAAAAAITLASTPITAAALALATCRVGGSVAYRGPLLHVVVLVIVLGVWLH